MQRFVDDLSPALREVVDAACMVRRVTRPALEAMLGRPCDDAFLAELATLPFVETAEDGLLVHDSVRQAIVSRMRAIDPVHHRALRLAAFAAIESMIEGTAPTGPQAWRLTADLLFLIERPEIRDAFFPTQDSAMSIDTALPEDEAGVRAILSRYETLATAKILGAWWREARQAFEVARDASGRVLAFSLGLPAGEVPPSLLKVDPLLRAWQAHLAASPGHERGALFVRRVLSEESGEGPCEARAALWHSAKKAYIAHPTQWALYLATTKADVHLPFLEQLGYRTTELVRAEERTLILEFGAAGIWSWLRGLARVGLAAGASSPATPRWRIDEAARGLVVEGEAVALTPLEYRALTYLVAHAGTVVTRDALLDHAWKQAYTGSNVVDALIRLLRKKLGAHAADLETVKGHGYRLTLRA